MAISTYPLFQIFRLIEFGEIFSRMEILVTGTFFTVIFLKISVIYQVLVQNTAEIFELKTMKPLIIPFGIIGVNLAFILFEDFLDNYFFGVFIYPLVAFPYQFLIPLISLMVAWVRKLPSVQNR